MANNYTYIVHSNDKQSLEEHIYFARVWMDVADIITKGQDNRWTFKTDCKDLEFAFKNKLHRDRFAKRVNDIHMAIRKKNHAFACALLPPKAYSRS
ncbi:hypothetical protein [Methylobacterium gossipiicola]|uniref:Uncharacterized protein n=1 Tax=Methylobacterium gossipiicola TaxID=582675 RepID=A0A1I2WNC1_9HYPH|nr:hypothetical protein [Methylobacterium gossipiicola]SFH01856.1 hypothetical protein SAMN05192565_12441 [Methylobacterium gossipiicola]